MSLTLANIDRRTLLIGGGVGVGLVVAWAAWPRRQPSALVTGEGEQAFGHFLKIGRDGRIVVAVPQMETGQGIWTALPQIAADELGAAWDNVAVEPAPHDAVYVNPMADAEGWFEGLGRLRRIRLSGDAGRITAGSTSIRAFEQPIRNAAGTARAMLISAAAQRWGVEPADCETADGFVISRGRTLSFGELAEEAAYQRPPGDPPRRKGRAARLIGEPLPRLDLPAKSDGSFRFAADVRLPDMLYASARLAPPGGRLTAFSREGAKRLRGVREVIHQTGWIAIVADSWWTAERAVKLAGAHFEAPETPDVAGVRLLFDRALANGDADNLFSRGDYAAAVAGSRPLAATYWVAPAQHLGLEPLTATVRFSGERLEVWAPTQAPGFARELAERSAGKAAGHVTFYPMPPGDSGGRAMEAEAIPISIELARRTGRPVQLNLSAAASQNHAPVAPPMLARLSALPGAGGITAALRMRVASAAGISASIARLAGAGAPERTDLRGTVPPYAIPHMRLDAVPVTTPFDTGYMRGGAERAATFCIESFIDELARAAGMDPLVFRIAMLGPNPRLAACLQAAAAAAGWEGGRPGSTLGLAAASIFGSHIALVVNATIAPDQRLQVHRLVAAVDCGRIVNPQLVRQQVEGAMIWALGLATVREPEWAAGMPRSRPVGALGLPRLVRSAEVEVHLMPSLAAPGGVSGLGAAVIAPAVANAIYAATGRRMRNLPFDPMSA